MWLEIIPFFIADNPSLIRFIHKFSKLALNHRYIAVKIFAAVLSDAFLIKQCSPQPPAEAAYMRKWGLCKKKAMHRIAVHRFQGEMWVSNPRPSEPQSDALTN